MHYAQLFDTLQNLMGFKPTAVQIAKILNLSKKAMYARQQRNSKFSEEEIAQIYAFYKVNNYERYNLIDTTTDKVEIPYYTNPNLKTDIKNPLVTSMWFDRELVENVWKKDPKNLRIIKMLGDKMDYGEYPLRNDDILIIDVTQTDAFISGVYVFTTHNDNYIFINRVSRKLDGSYKFSFLNPAYPPKIHSQEEIEKLDLKIVAKVVKNLSLTI